jgi:ElaB/YqjD/DUF883 family membrane-anchored ribosome-binding protein
MKKDIRKEAEVKAKKAIAEAEARFKKARKDMDAHIRKEPEKAVILAAAVGAAIGAVTMLALTRKKSQ